MKIQPGNAIITSADTAKGNYNEHLKDLRREILGSLHATYSPGFKHTQETITKKCHHHKCKLYVLLYTSQKF